MTMRRLLKLRGIREKLLVSFSILVTSIAVFVFAFFPASLERQAMRAETSKAQAISEVTAYSLGAGMFFDDSSAVREVLAGAARESDIAALVARDTAGNIVASISTTVGDRDQALKATPRSTTADGLMYVTESPIESNHVRVGTLTLAISLDDLHAEVIKARRMGAMVGLLIFAAGFLIVYAISTLVTRPLTAVSRTVERIAGGEINLRAEETSDAEVSQLVRAFNSMVNNLAEAQELLSANNAQLEARVDERTAELREAVAQQRQSQLALLASESQARATSEMLQTLVDTAPQAIQSVDTNWKLTRWNRAAEKLFGWTAEEVLGKPIPIIPPEMKEAFALQQKTMEMGQWANATEQVRVRKDGSRVHVLIAVSTIRDAAGVTVGHLAVLTDLTERKLLEDQLRQSQKMEAIGRLAGGVAHDFNNMLTVITSSAALLRETVTHNEDSDNVDAIATAALRASALTRQLLLFSRKQVVNVVPLNVNDVVADMDAMLRRLIRENIEVRSVLDSRLGDVLADPTQVQQAILNLVVNASDAMPDGGTLTIETHNVTLDAEYTEHHADVEAGEYVQLTISDTGIGMDSDTKGKIFEPFFTTKEPGVGTGLGLATTYAVVQQLGGHLRVYSELGNGTALKIFLPRLATSPTRMRVTPLATVAVPYAAEAVTVLLVEDEPSVRKAIRRTLERFGFTILEASDGESALGVAASHIDDIDIVLTDLMMPGMNGRAFADELAKIRGELPVIFMSGYTDDTVNQRGLVDATHAFLQKPFSGEQLSRTVRELLQDGEEDRAASSGWANGSTGGLP